MRILLLCMLLPLVATAAPDRRVVITIDDLPLADSQRYRSPAERLRVVRQLTDLLAARKVPVTGFFNMKQHADDGRLLAPWVKAGVAFGNHTWSHPHLRKVGLKRYVADLKKGHHAVRPHVPAGQPVPFRYPYLYQGFKGDDRDQIRAALKALGSPVAPVTIDTKDWLYARGWLKAKQAKDPPGMARWLQSYQWDLQESTERAERLARDLFGREPPQILLLHGNGLNAAHLGWSLDWLHARGYRFISLSEALADPAYQEVDRSHSPTGDSWWLRLKRSRSLAASAAP
jgi:peptidoglycan/xylan/chitin deacetylase (PgdA/CDA1 family)